MNGNWLEAMKAAISEVLETMYFTEVSFRDVTPGAEAFEGWRARIEVNRADGNQAVTLALWLRSGFAKELAGNLLALDAQEVRPEDVKDAMGELANMVAGSWINQLGPDAWRLGLPDAGPVECPVSGADNASQMFSYGEPVGFAAVDPVGL